MSLDSFLSDLAVAIRSKSVSPLLSINPKTNKYIPALQNGTQDLTNKQIANAIESKSFFQGNWPAFETMVESFIVFARDLNPWSILDSIDLMIKFFSDLSIALGNLTNSKLILPLLEETINLVVPLAKHVDLKLMKVNKRHNDFPRLSFVSTILLKSLNNVRSDPDLNTSSNSFKISILMLLSIELCKTYFFIKSPMLCNNVFSNINILKLNTRLIIKKHLVQYRFLCGKFHILQSNYTTAFNHFEYCFQNLHIHSNPQMLINILKYLIPCGLLVGKVFNLNLLQNLNNSILQNKASFLLSIYGPLIQSYKSGNSFQFSFIVFQNQSYFLDIGILVGLIQRTRIIIFRNLLHNVFKLNKSYITYNHIRLAVDRSVNAQQAQLIFQKNFIYYSCVDESSESFTDNLIISLMGNSLLKGKYAASTKRIVLSPSDQFPEVYKIYQLKYPKNSKEDWLDK